ncbi:MAG TPA: hypothetical protein VJJ46_01635 [Anaerolineales bacterium]|nr:hypothetical protein [Anaerolineales bacterium]
MRKPLVLILIGVITFSITTQVSADLSIPLYPPGSAVLPPGETMVQMVAETVEITISATSSRADYEARFSMRNQGSATEQMDVRFPLVNDAAWALDTPAITDFVAYVDGQRAPVRETEERFTLGDPSVSTWAVFPVTFEAGVDVLITVTYSTGISGSGWSDPDTVDPSYNDPFRAINPDTATVYYTLETGAGWYRPIESGVIVLRLPYAASPANVFDLDAELSDIGYGWAQANGQHLSAPFFAGNEVRWEFAQLEPSREDNLRIQFLWPDEWQRILSLQGEADESPEDPEVALQLAGAYLAAGANLYGYATEYHCSLSQQEIRRALVYHPLATELLESLDMVAAFCADVQSLFATITPSSTSIAIPTAGFLPTDEAEEATEPVAPTSNAGSPLLGVQGFVGFGVGFVFALILAAIWNRRTSR